MLGGEVLKRNTPYRDGSIPLVQYTGEGGYYYNIFSSPNKTIFLSIGGSAMLGYESVNGGKRLLYDGATLGQVRILHLWWCDNVGGRDLPV